MPFLYEIKSILDWTFTPTALSLEQWLKLEDIYKNLYIVKRDMQERLQDHKFGEERSLFDKICKGFLLVLLLLFIILFPILVFSDMNATSRLSNIESGIFSLELEISNNTNVLNF